MLKLLETETIRFFKKCVESAANESFSINLEVKNIPKAIIAHNIRLTETLNATIWKIPAINAVIKIGNIGAVN